MTGIYYITLNGNKERLHFNQYANAELANFLIPEERQSNIPEIEVMRAIVEKAKQNLPALIKMIVYAGIVGDSLVTRFEPRLTQEEIGKYVANAKDEELRAIWKDFLKVQYPNPEAEDSEKKKESL